MKIIQLAGLMIALLISGCSTAPLGPIYSERDVNAMAYNESATIIDLRPVVIQAQQDNTGKYVGAAVGAGLGGLLGSKIGKGKGKTAATIAGVALGGVAGAAAGQEVSNQSGRRQGVELIVRRGNGQTQSVIQEDAGEQFFPGQNVRLVQTQSGWHVSPI